MNEELYLTTFNDLRKALNAKTYPPKYSLAWNLVTKTEKDEDCPEFYAYPVLKEYVDAIILTIKKEKDIKAYGALSAAVAFREPGIATDNLEARKMLENAEMGIYPSLAIFKPVIDAVLSMF